MLYNLLVRQNIFSLSVVKNLNQPKLTGMLSIIPTPIGNMHDLTPNIIKSLYTADLIACEDRRVAGQLYTLIKNKNIIQQIEQQFGSLGLTSIVPVEDQKFDNDETQEFTQHMFYNYSNMGDKQRRKFLSKLSLEEQKRFKIQYLKYRAKKIINKNQQFLYKTKSDKFDELYGIQVSDFKHIQSQIINTRAKKNRGLLIPLNTYSQTKMFDLIKHLLESKHVALVSDAGMPCISDPGWRMVSMVRQSLADVKIQVVGGPSSVDILLNLAKISAKSNSLSGRFEGFASPQASNITEQSIKLDRNLLLAKQKDFSIHFINSRKLSKQIYNIQRIYGKEKKIIVTSQLTKKFERKFHGNVEQLINHISQQNQNFMTKGQMSYVMYPQQKKKQIDSSEKSNNENLPQCQDSKQNVRNLNIQINVIKFIKTLQSQSQLKSKQISEIVSTVFGLKYNHAKKIVYECLKS